ncbi:MAG: FlgD immunoglobulin-like domain containing protein [Candidatus Tenebribacter davisii]|nr:FlgD immunoglobulin-like domain containing protein [Candidatus Tenebribacter davisii]
MKTKLYLLLILLCLTALLNSTTWHIKQDGTGNFTTIQEGIDASTDADTLLVYPGTYYENLNFNGKNIVLASLELTTGDEQYISSTIIDGQRLESCIRIHNGETDARIQGFTIQNGFGTQFWSRDGGGILVHDYSTAYITNCTIKNNIATLGAGLYARHGFLHVSGLNIYENSAGWGGAIYLDDDSTIEFDTENLCNIYNNNAGKGADIIVRDMGPVDVIVDTFSVLDPSRYFAEYLEGATYTFSIQNSWMELEPHDLYVAEDGDDTNSGLTPYEPLRNISWAVRKIQADEQNPRTVHVAAGTYSWSSNQQIFPIGCKEYVSIIGEDMENTILFNEINTEAIVGAYLNGFTEMSNFSISNSSEMNTELVIFGYEINMLKLSNLKIQNNSNIRLIIFTEHVNNIFDNLIITNNTADRNAALILAENSGIMKNCVISNNTLNFTTHGYEAVMQLDAHDDEEFIVENCEFSNNNTSSSDSRIIRCKSGWGEESSIKFNNCLFSDNSTNYNTFMDVFNQGITEFNNCTFINNTSSYSTLKGFGDITMNNTIMQNNTNYEIFMADWTSVSLETYELNVDYSNIQNGENGIYNQNGVNTINWGEGNIDGDPLFLLSGDHPYQLSELSPCIDTGTLDLPLGTVLPAYDLAGNPRVCDSAIDMGAYEFPGLAAPINLQITDATLSWQVPDGFITSGYNIYFEGEFLTTLSGTITEYTFPDLIEEEPYIAGVSALYDTQETAIINLEFIYDPVGIIDDPIPIVDYQLYNYPNPFNPETNIVFNLPEEGRVQLDIYNIRGQKIRSLLKDQITSGQHSIVWNGKDDSGKKVSSGVYLYRLIVNSRIEAVKKCLLLK